MERKWKAGRHGFRKSDKRITLRKHAKRRALERYEIVLNRRDLKEIARMIQNGKSILLRRQSIARAHHEVEFCGVKMRLVYDLLRGEIVTFLPMENVDCGMVH